MADEMKPKLKALLTNNRVHADVVAEFVKVKCLSLEDFANWVEDRNQLHTHFLLATSQKDENAQLAKIKMAWRQAEALCAKALERKAAGQHDEELDEPLETQQADSLHASFKAAYSWCQFPPERFGVDTLLGRVFREFAAYKPTVFSVSKVRTLAAATGGRPTGVKRKLGDNVTVTIDGDDDSEVVGGTLFAYLFRLEVLGNVWVVAGIEQVEHQTKMVRFAYWPDVDAYVKKFRDEGFELLIKFTEQSVLDYITGVEEFFRSKAIAMVRGDEKVPFGIALTRALKENASAWDHKNDILIPRRGGTASSNSGPSSAAGGTWPPQRPGAQDP